MQASYSKISQKIDQICSKNKTKLRNVLTARTEICRYISHKTPYCPIIPLGFIREQRSGTISH